MPEIVLRNSATGAPFVFPAGADGVVPFEFKAAGWELDPATDPAAARDELAGRAEAAERDAAGVPFVASFAPDPDAPVAASPSPTPVAPTGVPADTNLEN